MRGGSDGPRESDRGDDAPHPRDTARLFGHRAAELAMLDAYRTARLSHAWLIGGPRGIGKATLAWRFARFVMAYPDPLDPKVAAATDLAVPAAHPILGRLRSGAHGDVSVLRRQWNDKSKKFYDEIRVDDVRQGLQLFQRAAGAGGYRICILDSAEDLNRSSANALLKMIEEPPPRSLFLIVAHQPSQVMPTILSRCRKLMLGALDRSHVRATLQAIEGREGLADADLDAALDRGGGSVGRTLELLDHDRVGLDRDLRTELDRLPTVDARVLHRLADRLGGATGEGPIPILLDTVLDWIDTRVGDAARSGADGRSLAPLAEVWDKVGAAAREAEALNLDHRPLLLSIFGDLAQAIRHAGHL